MFKSRKTNFYYFTFVDNKKTKRGSDCMKKSKLYYITWSNNQQIKTIITFNDKLGGCTV